MTTPRPEPPLAEERIGTGIVAVTPVSSPELLSQARELLARAQTLEEVLHIRNTAQAATQYFKAAEHSREMAKEAAEIRLRAERKAGQMLADMKDRRERQGQGGDRKSNSHDGSLVRLADLDITANQSSRYQEIAKVPEPVFERYIEDGRNHESNELTTSGLKMLYKLERRAAVTDAAKLPSDKFRVIYADPPWKYGDQLTEAYGATQYHYPSMSVDELCALPVADLAEPNAVLFLWTTCPQLESAFEVLKAWGFSYRSGLVWDKVRHNFGHYVSVRHEHLLVAVRGSCTPDVAKLYDSVVTIERTTHSRKPPEFRQMIDTLYPYGKRIELFAREKTAGWVAWGNQAAVLQNGLLPDEAPPVPEGDAVA